MNRAGAIVLKIVLLSGVALFVASPAFSQEQY
jgi:hypothetical protein